MSGSYWSTIAFQIQQGLSDIAKADEDNGGYMEEHFLKLAKIFNDIGSTLYTIIHALDYDYSYDQAIEDKKLFEKEAIEKLKNIFKDY